MTGAAACDLLAIVGALMVFFGLMAWHIPARPPAPPLAEPGWGDDEDPTQSVGRPSYVPIDFRRKDW